MNKKLKYILTSLVLVMFLAVSIKVLADRKNSPEMNEWGGILKDYATRVENDNVYARGINVVISNTDIEMATDFYKVSGLGEQEAREKAIKYVSQREALYVEAIRNGYSVTDEEVWAYLEELKKILYSADNSDDVWEIISQFNSEEDYWNFEFTVYQKDLPIQNYVADIEKSYMDKISVQSSVKVDNTETVNTVEENFQEYFQQLKNELVTAEEIDIIE